MSIRDTFYLVPASAADLPYSRVLAHFLERHRSAVEISGEIPIGSSLIEHADAAIARAQALVFITGAGKAQDDLPRWQVVQFRYALSLGADAWLIIVPQAPFLFGVPHGPKTLLLPEGLSAEQAGRHCLAALRFHSSDVTSDPNSELPPPDRYYSGALSDGAWSTVRDLGATYDDQARLVLELLGFGYREAASLIYWKIFHYSGYRELWSTRMRLSRALLRATKAAGDHREAGLILSKGLAYVHIIHGRSTVAEHALRAAYGHFARANDSRGRGVCWNYMADLSVMSGNVNAAIQQNQEAIALASGVDKYEMHLKNELLKGTLEDLSASQRLARLEALRSGFEEVENYRLGIVDMELATTLLSVGQLHDALTYATRAAHFFNVLARMPRHATPAEKLVVAIRGRLDDSSE